MTTRTSRTKTSKVAKSVKSADSENTTTEINASLEVVAEVAAPVKRKAGRPKGTGKYGEKTKSVRLPLSLLGRVDSFVQRRGMVFPFYDCRVQAGFPSPAEDVPCDSLDVASLLVPHPASTFFIKVIGESMHDAGVFPDDVLIVDRSLTPENGDVVVAVLDGEFTVKRLFKTKNRIELRPENKRFAPIKIASESELQIWGVVKKVIHNV